MSRREGSAADKRTEDTLYFPRSYIIYRVQYLLRFCQYYYIYIYISRGYQRLPAAIPRLETRPKRAHAHRSRVLRCVRVCAWAELDQPNMRARGRPRAPPRHFPYTRPAPPPPLCIITAAAHAHARSRYSNIIVVYAG